MGITGLPEKGKRVVMYSGLSALATAGLLFAGKMFFHKAPVTGIYVSTPAAKGMPDAPTKSVTIAVPLRVHDKERAVKAMKLPPSIASDPKLELESTGRVKAPDSDYVATVAAVTDTTTGITSLETKMDRPLFGFGGRSYIGALAGITNKGETALVYLGQDVIRIGPVNVGVVGGGGAMGPEVVYGGLAHVHGSF